MTTITAGTNASSINSFTSDDLTGLSTGTLGAHSSTQFVLTQSPYIITGHGTGFVYSGNHPVSGTLTSLDVDNSSGVSTWSGFSLAAATVWNAIATGNVTAFNNLFFSGNDTFNMETSSGYDTLIGGGGDDTFNFGGDFESFIDGGPGTDTLNLDGQHIYNQYSISNVELIHLAAGHSYDLFSHFGNTVDGSALGASDTVSINASVATTLLGGAGNDTFVSGASDDTFNGGAGNDTISYATASGGVTVNLSITSPQAVGGGAGTDTLISVENVIGTTGNDTIIGNSSDNVIDGHGGNDVLSGGDGNDLFYASGNSTIDGGNGYDTVSYAYSGSITIDLRSGPLVSIEGIIGSQYPGDLFIGNSADNTFDSGGHIYGSGYPDTVDYEYATGAMTFTQTTPTTIVATGGGQGTDTLIGFQRIIGSNYDDTFNLTQDYPTYIGGGGGFDTATFQAATAGVVLQDPGFDYVVGSNFADTITVSLSIDYFIDAAGGDDVFVRDALYLREPANDMFIGGAGTDSVYYDYAYWGDGAVTYNSDHSVTVSSVFGTDTLWGIEKIIFPNKTITVASAHVAIDFDGDTHSDLLWQNTDGTPVEWLMNGTALVSGGAAGPNPGTAWHVIGSGDFNGDGKADILWQNSDGTPVAWFMNGTALTGGGILGFNPGSSWHVICAGDFNGDGYADLLWQNADGTPAIWLMNGTTILGGASLLNVGSAWHIVGAGDFNGDGKSDILWQNTDGTPAIWLMNGTTLQSGAAFINPGTAWHVIGAGDFDGDGKSDILWQNTDGTPDIWFMNGTSFVSAAVAGFNPGSPWHAIGSGDFNGDGKADIAWQNTDGTPAIWLMNGATISSGAAYGNPGSSWHIIAMGS